MVKSREKCLHQCFKKIRITEKPPKKTLDYQICQQMLNIKLLKEQYKRCHDMLKCVLRYEIIKAENLVAELQGNRCKNFITEDMKHLLKEDHTL